MSTKKKKKMTAKCGHFADHGHKNCAECMKDKLVKVSMLATDWKKWEFEYFVRELQFVIGDDG